MELLERTPAEKFWDMHFLGNGKLGMSVKGAPTFEEILLNEDTLWSGSEQFEKNPGHFQAMEKVRELLAKDKLNAANQMVEEEMYGKLSEGYLPLAKLHLIQGMKNGIRNSSMESDLQETGIEDYKRILDIENAVETVSWKKDDINYKREFFVSAPEMAGYIYCKTEKKQEPQRKLNFALALESELLTENEAEEGMLIVSGRVPDHAEPNYSPVPPKVVYKKEEKSTALRFACSVKVAGTDGTVHNDGTRLYVTDASFAIIVVRALTNYEGYGQKRNPDTDFLVKKLKNKSLGSAAVLQKRKAIYDWEYEKLKEEHIEDYKKFYNRVSICLPEEKKSKQETSLRLKDNTDGSNDPSLAALVLQYSRYLMISGSRPGSEALNLQGIWNDKVNPPWASNYTTNINLEMNYWLCEALGLSECHLPLFELLKKLADAGTKTAKEYYHLSGWVVHHNTDFWCNTEPSCGKARWSWWPMAGAWLCSHIKTHYQFTKNRDFLKEMYPVMQKAVEFYLGFLIEDLEGYLVTAPSTSPENTFWFGEKSEMAVSEGCTMDMELLRDLFQDYVNFSKILDKDNALAKQANNAIAKLLPFKIGHMGQLQEWKEDYQEDAPGNPHTSHLYAVYPSDQISFEKTPDLAEAAVRSLEDRLLHLRQQNGWGASWKIAIAARLKKPFICNLMLKQLYECLGAGMLTKEGQQIDAIFGAGAAITEMLLQSHNGYIEILPALPVGWDKGSFSGFRARGGFIISAEWYAGKITELSITSLCGEKCRIKAKGAFGLYSENVLCKKNGEILEFLTEVGQEYKVRV